MKIVLRTLTQADLEKYKYWQLSIHRYHHYNGPYFKKPTQKEIETEIKRISSELQKGNKNPVPQKKIISNRDNEILGEVNWYWKSKETNWLEIGIVIFNENNWGKGIGQQALELWINEIFLSNSSLVRIGLTTWSGNQGMIHLAKKLGWKKEAEYRKARIVKGEYYDSVSYGILKDEWESTNFNTDI